MTQHPHPTKHPAERPAERPDAFTPTRTAGLARLAAFAPGAGTAYAAGRNADPGPGRYGAVSQLSPWIRHRLVTEQEVLQTTLGRHSASAAAKFIDEVFWRAYWKGWLEMRPSVWAGYRAGVARGLDRVATEAGLRRDWEAACHGETGIAGFDDWAQELVTTGWMHNHARMWFASIWIFTLRLPWELGADFFLRHLMDADAAVNTLSWRWVAGLHTPGKTYLATTDNIRRYTAGRFAPTGLARDAHPVAGTPNPPAMALDLPRAGPLPQDKVGLILHDEDLSPWFLADTPVEATLVISARAGLSPLAMGVQGQAFAQGAAADAVARWQGRLGSVSHADVTVDAIADWAAAEGLAAVRVAHAPVGPTADLLSRAGNRLQTAGLVFAPVVRPYDARAWPHGTHGFFWFREAIPRLLDAL